MTPTSVGQKTVGHCDGRAVASAHSTTLVEEMAPPIRFASTTADVATNLADGKGDDSEDGKHKHGILVATSIRDLPL